MMLSVPRQLALALDHVESFAREDFLSGPPNAQALALIDLAFRARVVSTEIVDTRSVEISYREGGSSIDPAPREPRDRRSAG